MTLCYMCGRLLKKEAEMRDVTTYEDIFIYRTVDYGGDEYD